MALAAHARADCRLLQIARLRRRGLCNLHGDVHSARAPCVALFRRASARIASVCSLQFCLPTSEVRPMLMSMMDALLVASTLLFFALAWAYALGCERI
jgi:hypothetical protein